MLAAQLTRFKDGRGGGGFGLPPAGDGLLETGTVGNACRGGGTDTGGRTLCVGGIGSISKTGKPSMCLM